MSNNCERRWAGCKTNTALAAGLLAGSVFVFAIPAQATPYGYDQIDLVTDNQAFLTSLGYGAAATVDPNLVNPWGISHTATSPFWVANNGTSTSTLYNGAGVPQGGTPPLVVGIPPTDSGPTGTVANIGGATDFQVNGVKSNFIFATEAGTIAAWRGTLVPNTAAVTVVNNSGVGAVYKGLAIGQSASGFVLYAADFSKGTVDVFDNNFQPKTLSGNFSDPNLPAGYAPFNVQVLNGSLYVTYALQDLALTDDVPGAGHGIVDQYSLNGALTARVATQGPLNSPWGLDLAPAGFGQYANDLLVGNFGDGIINVFDPNSFAYLGTINNGAGNPLVIDGLWGLSNGPASGANPNYVYFSAGIGDEAHGLFGALAPAPEPASLALLGGGLVGMAGMSAMRRRRKAVA